MRGSSSCHLSPAECRRLAELAADFRERRGYSLADPAVRAAHFLAAYISELALFHAARVERAQHRLADNQRRAALLQRLEHFLGRPPVAGDIVAALSEVDAVPARLAEAIRRDVGALRP